MRVYALPNKPAALLFDFDSTLYTNKAYATFQNEVLIERLARERGESHESVQARLEGLKAERKAAGIASTSLGNLFAALGIDIATSVRWREELIDPAAWLGPDPGLALALGRLSPRFRLALVTNNPASVGRRGLEALGVQDFFPTIIGLDDSLRSKPDPEPYRLAAERLGLGPEVCVSIGDRYDVDLAPALGLGMGAILVDGVEEVYALPRRLDPQPLP